MPRSILFGVLAFAAGAAIATGVAVSLLPNTRQPATIVTAPPAEGPAEPPAAPVAAPPAAAPCEVQAVAPRLPVAPLPREAEETRCYRSDLRMHSYPPDSDDNVIEDRGVEWQVKVGVRRLASTGRDVIDFRWRLKYAGPRSPLIIERPALADGYEGTTTAHVYAFPPGKDEGRMATFTGPVDTIHGAVENLFLRVPRGETATGTETLLVADVKDALRARWPAEFASDAPPKLYAELHHKSWRQGFYPPPWGFDAWTGDFGSQHYMEVPDLKTW